jgi:5-(carboxyamino)imidazole ribonucleotide mutase
MSNQPSKPQVGIIMGSDSDLPVMQAAADALTELGVPYEMTIVSAHRTPKRLYDYAGSALGRGLKVIIAGAGGAAHLPGMVAAITPLPVIGVPVKSKALSGEDSLLSIVQMPPGVPVATVAIDGARNAGLLAAQILGVADQTLLARVERFKQDLEAQVLGKVERMAAGEITAESVAKARAKA